MTILEDDLGHDRLQALAVAHALADVQGDIPEAALESLGEGSPVGVPCPTSAAIGKSSHFARRRDQGSRESAAVNDLA